MPVRSSGTWKLNLASPLGHTPPIHIGTATSFTAHIVPASGKTWSTAVADLEFSVGDGRYETWVARTPSVQWTTSAKFQRNIAVVGLNMIRLRTTTAEAANDPAATVIWTLE